MKQLVLNLAADVTRPFAAPAAVDAVAPAGIGSLGQVTLALGLVLAFIFGIAWMTRRMRGFGKPRGAAFDVLADLPLGQKERAVLIRCGTTQLLLGVAPGRVTTLHTFAPGECPHPNPPPATGGGNESSYPLPRSPGEGQGGGTPNTPRPDFKTILKRSLGL